MIPSSFFFDGLVTFQYRPVDQFQSRAPSASEATSVSWVIQALWCGIELRIRLGYRIHLVDTVSRAVDAHVEPEVEEVLVIRAVDARSHHLAPARLLARAASTAPVVSTPDSFTSTSMEASL